MTNWLLRTLNGALWTAMEAGALVAFLACLSIMFLQVVSRDVLAIAVPWTDEAARYSFIVAIFLGAALCHRGGSHLRVTILLDALPTRLRTAFEALAEVLVAIIGAALCAGATIMAFQSTTVTAAALPVTLSWLYGVQALGIALVTCLALRRAVLLATGHTGELAR